jgi:hypothetical protein
MITAQQITKKLTIDALGMYLHSLPAEQMVERIEKAAPLLDWNKPMESVFDGQPKLAVEQEVLKANQKVGGKDDVGGRRR